MRRGGAERIKPVVIDTAGVEIVRSNANQPERGKQPNGAWRDILRKGMSDAVRDLRKTGKRRTAIAAFAAMAGIAGYAQKPDSFGEALDQKAVVFSEGKDEKLPSYEEMERELVSAVGEELFRDDVIPRVDDLPKDLVPALRERARHEERASHPANIEGFEEAFGVSDKSLTSIMTGTLPRGWASATNVDRLRVAGEDLPHDAIGMCVRGGGSRPAEILIAENIPISQLPSTIIHEFAHANAWNTAAAMAPERRIALFYRTYKRVTSSDRIRFADVERNTYADAHEETLKKVREYWARLTELALTTEADEELEWIARMNVKIDEINLAKKAELPSGISDPELALDLLREHDPEFKPWEAAKERRNILDGMAIERMRSGIDRGLEDVPNAPIRTILSARLHREVAPLERDALRIHEARLAPKKVELLPEDLQRTRRVTDEMYDENRNRALDGFSRRETDAVDAFARVQELIDRARIDRPRWEDQRLEGRIAEINEGVKAFVAQFSALPAEEQRRVMRACGDVPSKIDEIVASARTLDGGLKRWIDELRRLGAINGV